jgi:hypothetical protein
MKTSTATRTASLHTTTATPSDAKPLADVMAFVDTARMPRKYEPGWFAEVERTLHAKMMAIEREMLADIMSAHDVDAAAIEIEGVAHRRVLRADQTYVTAAGPVTVERWLYRDRSNDAARSVSPMELRLGVVGEFWTEHAAKTALWVVAQMTPQKAEDLFGRIGGMTPSKSSLDRLPKLVSDCWEARREDHEAALRDALVIPKGAVSVAVSLDGVLAPIDGGNAPVAVRNAAARDGRTSKVQLDIARSAARRCRSATTKATYSARSTWHARPSLARRR